MEISFEPLDPSSEIRRLQILIDLCKNEELTIQYLKQQTEWVRLLGEERQTSGQQELLAAIDALPVKIATLTSDLLVAKSFTTRMRVSRMTSLSATPESASTPAIVSNEHTNVVTLEDHTNYPVRPAVNEEFYLKKIHVNFEAVNGRDRYEWITTPNHFLLKDHSKSGSSVWIIKRNKNVVNARNTLLEMHSVNYNVDLWFNTDFGSGMNYEGTTTP